MKAWGFDLSAEYRRMLQAASFLADHPVVDLATGSGRMAAELARAGYRVLTGDLTLELHARAMDRIAPPFAHAVSFFTADMDALPLLTASVRSLVCVNTIHELAHPGRALEELLRVLHPEGILLVADFNERGFLVMQRLHCEIYKNEHPRGELRMDDVEAILRERGATCDRLDTELNIALVSRGNATSAPGTAPA